MLAPAFMEKEGGLGAHLNASYFSGDNWMKNWTRRMDRAGPRFLDAKAGQKYPNEAIIRMMFNSPCEGHVNPSIFAAVLMELRKIP